MTTAARNDRMTARYSAMVARAMRDAHARLLPSGRGCYELPSGRGCCVLPSGGGCYHDEHEHGYEHGRGHGHEHEHEHGHARVHGPHLVRLLLRLLVLLLCCSAALRLGRLVWLLLFMARVRRLAFTARVQRSAFTARDYGAAFARASRPARGQPQRA